MVSRVFFFFLLLVEGFGRSVAVAALVGVVFSGMTIWLCSASVVFSGFSQFGFAAIRWKVKENKIKKTAEIREKLDEKITIHKT